MSAPGTAGSSRWVKTQQGCLVRPLPVGQVPAAELVPEDHSYVVDPIATAPTSAMKTVRS